MRDKKSLFFLGGGLLLIAAALFLTFHNIWEERQAAAAARAAAQRLEAFQAAALAADSVNALPASDMATSPQTPDYIQNPDMEMPTLVIDGHDYIGTLEIPALGLSLPVMSQWSYPKLKLSPCRFAGSAYQDNLIIAGHNYARHFGGLKNLRAGDELVFTDVNGNRFAYTAEKIEQLEPDEAEKLEAGGWALTLFTCTLGGQHRVTVRCSRQENGQ